MFEKAEIKKGGGMSAVRELVIINGCIGQIVDFRGPLLVFRLDGGGIIDLVLNSTPEDAKKILPVRQRLVFDNSGIRKWRKEEVIMKGITPRMLVEVKDPIICIVTGVSAVAPFPHSDLLISVRTPQGEKTCLVSPNFLRKEEGGSKSSSSIIGRTAEISSQGVVVKNY